MDSRLILMRHAKSSHGDPSLSDHQRPLNPRGQRDSPRMARWLVENDLQPEIVLSSTSQRTRETLDLMLPELGEAPEIHFLDSLYLSNVESILWTISSEHRSYKQVMVLGHNPGISIVASVLSGQVIQMPTAAIAVIAAETDALESDSRAHWLEELDPHTPCRLTTFVTPKGLDSHQ